MPKTLLSTYNNYPYKPGGGVVKRFLWYYVNLICFKSGWFPFNAFKIFLLRLFGAQIGNGVVIKPGVNIKYAWNLKIGTHSWIGESVWIDNLAPVIIADNVCISQGAMLQTGSHNYKKESFELITGNITIEDGVWIGCGAILNQGITAGSHSVVTSGSVANKNLEPYFIYQGNPAVKLRPRIME
ncbi:WcaF family extracellular polysaccharide biosynthesis acetyltransferase [Mucilaginibacter sp. AK015]|uniref:WcaF family extracellular polysaccharide biosynthesis acetyltransferase n=1 Tax=Mucilaginibacter sp. AK015 TaxID=2723072 RepID=UPI001618D75A|nr:WcaF family extracellular polysaccharide biosynthesis acetyltransferase [Mucilaginibacter sp. AK015]MBB5394653.1 putative colanic acid biosynthesis acetyltransferase WcaF [Mucilaginibacter sp. AK015]